MAFYTVETGRAIYKDGEPFIGITRAPTTVITTADQIVHRIAALLNGERTYKYCGDTYQTSEEI